MIECAEDRNQIILSKRLYRRGAENAEGNRFDSGILLPMRFSASYRFAGSVLLAAIFLAGGTGRAQKKKPAKPQQLDSNIQLKRDAGTGELHFARGKNGAAAFAGGCFAAGRDSRGRQPGAGGSERGGGGRKFRARSYAKGFSRLRGWRGAEDCLFRCFHGTGARGADSGFESERVAGFRGNQASGARTGG